MAKPMHDKDIFKEFERRKRLQLIVLAPIILVMLSLLLIGDDPKASFLGLPRLALVWTAAAVAFGAAVFSLFNWRCPACESLLGRGLSPNFCSQCGAQLQ